MTRDDLVAAVTGLLGRPLAVDELIAVAVSGGGDSLALLILAHAAFGERVRVLTVDHGLRDGSAAEAAVVAGYADSLGVEHATLHWTGPKPTGNLQAAARDARYALMARWCATNGVTWLATAHHRDDAAETMLLRLARGSGVGGLCGIRSRRDLGGGIALIRPLLAMTKPDLARIVSAAGWTAADDPSNRADRFDRTRARALLAVTPWLDPARLAASAAHVADAEAALVWAADAAWRSRVEVEAAIITIDAVGLPHDLARRLLLRAVATLAPDTTPRGDGVEGTLRQLTAGAGGTLGGVAVRPVVLNGGLAWRFVIAPARRKP